jgi:Vacuolar protein sorting 55
MLTLCSLPANTPNPSQVLAIGFLLVILSSALFHKYLPLLVVAIYIIAPLPNWICGRCANPDDFMENAGNAVIDFGRFCTGFLVVMGIGMLEILRTLKISAHTLLRSSSRIADP